MPCCSMLKVVAVLVGVLCLRPCCCVAFARTTERPNLILIIADDMNWDDSGAYGHPHIRTPNIDRLAVEGLRFDRAYLTTSSCSPSRSSIITGRYPHQTGAEQLHWPLPADAVTFVEKLKENGYYTAAAGKWHLGPAVKDRFDTVHEASAAGFQLPSGKAGEAQRMVARQPSGCEDWVRTLQERPRDRPFFLWLAALDPHREYEAGTLDPPHTLADVVVPPQLPDTPQVREDLRMYYDEIGRLDRYVGLVLEELQSQKITSETLILFISDNGRPFPGFKTTLTPGGIKTPWIVRWPAVVAPGGITESLVSAVDIAPTFLELAGIPASPEFEGLSFARVLRDPAVTFRQYAFAEKHWHDYEDHQRAVVSPRFELIRNDYQDLPATPPADAGRSPTWRTMQRMHAAGQLSPQQIQSFLVPRPHYELYDLQKDPEGFHNLAGDPQYAKMLGELIQVQEDWAIRTGDFIPSVRTPDEFDRETGEPLPSRQRPRRSKQKTFGTNAAY